MKKRLMMALATGALVAAMVPGATSAAGDPEGWVISTETCGQHVTADPSDIGAWVTFYRNVGFCGLIGVRPA